MKSDTELKGQPYKTDIFFLNKKDITELLFVKLFLESPVEALEIYQPIINRDTYKFVFEGGHPAYHKSKECDKLILTYVNYWLPPEILRRAKDEGGETKMKHVAQMFRSWFVRNQDVYKKDIKVFKRDLQLRWGVNNIEEINFSTPRIAMLENYELNELEKIIDDLIRQSKIFFVKNPEKQNIIQRYQKHTYRWQEKYRVETDGLDISEEELRSFLRHYEETFKLPIIKYLREYYRIKYNPDLSFAGDLLDRLNFKACSHCFEGKTQIDFDKIDMTKPF